VGKPERKNHLEDIGVDGRITLKWIFVKWDGGPLTGFPKRRGKCWLVEKLLAS
jgi:hypothetical protein